MDSFENITRDILHTSSNQYTDYYLNYHGLVLKNLEKGVSFKLKKIVAVIKHGLSTIDSGPGPIYHLILEDENGRLHNIAHVYLGEVALAVEFKSIDSQGKGQKVFKWINSDTFEKNYFEDNEDKKFIYTGKFTNLDEKETQELNQILLQN